MPHSKHTKNVQLFNHTTIQPYDHSTIHLPPKGRTKTELDEVKCELEAYKKSQKVKKKFKLRIMAYAKNFAHIPQIQLKSTLTITIFGPTSMLNIKDNKKSKK